MVGASQGALVVKNPSANAGDIRDVGLIPGLGRSPGGGYGSPLQYSCLENPMDRGAWRATVYGVTKSRTQLKRLIMHAHAHYFGIIISLNFVTHLAHFLIAHPIVNNHIQQCHLRCIKPILFQIISLYTV